MSTPGKIQLRAFFSMHIDAVDELLSYGYPKDKNAQRGMRESLLMLDAYMTLTDLNPLSMNLYDYAGFRGFLTNVFELSEESSKEVISPLLKLFVDVGALSETLSREILGTVQSRCNEEYQEREPTKCQFLEYQSLFPTMEPGGVVYVDIGSIMHLLSEASFHCLSELLARYLAPLSTEQAEIDAPLIIAVAQGLLYQHPGVDFGDIRLSAANSADFIGGVRSSSEWQMHNAGYFRGDVAENWKYLSAVLLNFFIANNICRLNDAGRRLLAPY